MPPCGAPLSVSRSIPSPPGTRLSACSVISRRNRLSWIFSASIPRRISWSKLPEAVGDVSFDKPGGPGPGVWISRSAVWHPRPFRNPCDRSGEPWLVDTPPAAGGPLRRRVYRTMTAGRAGGAVGSAARRGPVFTLGEPGPFPGSLPPNPACAFKRTRLSSDLCRVRDGFRVDEIMTCGADDKGFPPHFRHECRPRGLTCSRFPEFLEAGDLVNCHRGPGLAEFAFPCEEPSEQFLARERAPRRVPGRG